MDYQFNFTSQIKIIPLANESIGVRGFSFLILLGSQIRVLVDPSVSLAPRRKGLVPHPFEISLSWLFRDILLKLSSKSNFIFITHYHGDHYTIPWNRKLEFTSKEAHEQIYFRTENLENISFKLQTKNENILVSARKIIFAINPKHVTWNQKKRARYLWEKTLPERISLFPAERTKITTSDHEIKVSKPLPHGYDDRRGKVTAISITDLNTKKKVVFSSDLEGATNPVSLDYLLRENPDLIFLDGAGIYHPKVTEKEITLFVKSIVSLMDNGAKIILTHHFNRMENRDTFFEENGLPRLPSVFGEITGFQYFLESIRKELWETYPFKEQCDDPRKPYYVLDFEISPFIEELFHKFPKIRQFFDFLKSIA